MIFHKILWYIAYPFVKLLWLVKFEKPKDMPKTGPVVLCCNHISYLDPVLLELSMHRWIYFMAKQELFRNKLFAALIKFLGAFPVKRGTGDQEAINTGFEILDEGKVMGIFPEGGRSKDGKLMRAKAGAVLFAAKTGAPIQVMAIKTKNQKVRLFKPITVKFGRLIDPSEFQIDSPHSTAQMREASKLIMDEIARLLEE